MISLNVSLLVITSMIYECNRKCNRTSPIKCASVWCNNTRNRSKIAIDEKKNSEINREMQGTIGEFIRQSSP